MGLTVEVEIISSDLLKRLVESFLNLCSLVRVVPELGGDEELLALDDGRDDLLQGAADLILILVDAGKIEMPVAIADSDLNLW